MSDEFKTVLTQSTNFHLRSLVLDAITHGEVLQTELIDILLALFCDDNAVYGERSGAFAALLRFDNGQQLIVQAVKEKLSNSADSIRLKKEVMTSIYANNFTHHDIIELINDYINTRYRTSGSLWYLSYYFPIEDLANILDNLLTIDIENDEVEYDVSSFCYKSIHRILIDKPNIEVDKLWSWLSNLPLNSCYHKNEIKDWLKENQDYVLKMFEYALNKAEFNKENSIFLFLQRFHDATYSILKDKEIISYLFNFISQKDNFNEKEQQIFGLILSLSIHSSDIDTFTSLYDFGIKHVELTKILDEYCQSILPNWRQEQITIIKNREKQKIENQQKYCADFKRELNSILTGQHFGWLEWLANVYFSKLSDVDAQQTPKERLTEQLGEENANFALEGLRAVINRTDLPSQNEIIKLYINNKYHRLYYAILAGITEDYVIRKDLNFYSKQLLKSALAINLLYPSPYSREENTISQSTPDWQQALFEQQPELVQTVYLEIIETLAKAKKKYINGIRVICEDSHLIRNRDSIVFKLLNDYPDINAQDLETLLSTALDYLDKRNELIVLIKQALSKTMRLKNRVLWLLTEFLIDFESFKTRFKDNSLKITVKNKKIISEVICFFNQKNTFQLSIEQLAFLISLIGSIAPNKQRPMISGAYRSLECDKADFVKVQINKLSAHPSEEAGQVLAELINAPKLASYHNELKHAADNQMRIYRQAQFNKNRLNWQTTIDTLAKGKPANMADLHALTLEYLEDIAKTIRTGGNTDIYKVFWNDKNKDGVITQKREEYCRDRLIDLLRPKFVLLDINVEPETHRANDKEVDILIDNRLPIEVKCDDHAELWTACENQLQRLYTCDKLAEDYGIYLVLWFNKLKSPPRNSGIIKPTTPEELKTALESQIKKEDKEKIAVVVIDVTYL